MELRETNDAAYAEAFAEANCKTFVFRCRARLDKFQDQERYGFFLEALLFYPQHNRTFSRRESFSMLK